MYEEIFIQEYGGEDCRSAGHHFEDQWQCEGHYLFNNTLFTLKEILELF